MRSAVLQSWWYLVIRGLLGILFGIAVLSFPESTVKLLVLLFGAYAVVDGLSAVMFALSMSDKSRVWMVLLEGTLGILVGIIAFLWPELTALMMLYVIATWAVVTGLLGIAAATWFRRVGLDGLILTASGVFSVALGASLFFAPQPGMILLVRLLGAYGLVFGALLIWLGLRLRQLHRTDEGPARPSAGVPLRGRGHALQ